MTTIFDIDLSEINKAINSLIEQLPPESELTQRLSQQTLLWTATLQEAKILFAVQQSLQLIEEQKANLANQALNPVLEQIQNLLLQGTKSESKIAPSSTTIAPKKKQPAQVESKLDENSYRQYCWKLAHCVNLTDSIGELDELRQRNPPTAQPQKGDIVLHGTVLNADTPIWIAPIKAIPAFSQLAKILAFNPQGEIWLDFSDVYTDKSKHLELSVPKWCQEKPDTHLLLHKWVDLLYWTVMTPDYSVFLTGQQQLSIDRENILTSLLTIHDDFELGFNKPEEYEESLGYNLSQLYAVFHQFLSAEDIAFDTVPKNVFANLRRCVTDNINRVWRKQLSIAEEQSAGAVDNRNKATYIAAVISDTETMNNIQLDLQHPFSKEIKAEKSQVLYWTRPCWKQPTLSPTHYYFGLKGSVLYCYE